ncbi:Peroxidase 1 [Hibiscus syriacus]|uniref:Peroxidase n=1 Tax=Hibiscus syriacus TaxID=106335 RepID=A0A6A3CC67_HIBSY|nr:peroxidase 27-like [Hibiscus syriacus]KAE8726895.1 Peroxidase 1 [Hibiscus syriacus]
MATCQKLLSCLFLQLIVILMVSNLSNAQGLKLGYYHKTCPNAESIIQKATYRVISRAPTLAAPLLRLHFHDCFVRGCDGSVLLNSTKNNLAEKAAVPNLSLRGFNVIDSIKAEVEEACPGVVSCADVVALVARDSVSMIHGPYWEVPLGRRDGRVSIMNQVFAELPAPLANITTLRQMFAAKGLNMKDLAVLSGGHTIGTSHCNGFTNRLYNFTGRGDTDPTLDPNYIVKLRQKCKPGDTKTLVEMDPGSFKTFDEAYFTLVAKRRGLFQSDAALLDDPETKAYVFLQATTHGSTFAKDFAESMVKMGRARVLTGNQGEIRKHCAFVN